MKESFKNTDNPNERIIDFYKSLTGFLICVNHNIQDKNMQRKRRYNNFESLTFPSKCRHIF